MRTVAALLSLVGTLGFLALFGASLIVWSQMLRVVVPI
jgi:hypothetical protein